MKTLDSIAKRDLLAAKKFDSETIKDHANNFFEEERYGDALAFYMKINDTAGICQVKYVAIRLGNPDLLWQIRQKHQGTVSHNDWLNCGKNAMRLEKFRPAAYAFERIGETELLAAAEKEFKPLPETNPKTSPNETSAES